MLILLLLLLAAAAAEAILFENGERAALAADAAWNAKNNGFGIVPSAAERSK